MKLPDIKTFDTAALVPYLFLLVIAVAVIWGIYTREAEREYPADYETIGTQIEQVLHTKASLERNPSLKPLATYWQLAVKLANYLNLELTYTEPTTRQGVQYTYKGAAMRWDGVVSGPAFKVILFFDAVQHEVPIFLNQMEFKNGTLSVLVSIIGGES